MLNFANLTFPCDYNSTDLWKEPKNKISLSQNSSDTIYTLYGGRFG